MRRAAKLSSIGLTLTLALVHCASASAASLGVLRGVVRDQTGMPLVGASVAIFDVASKLEKPVRATSTGEGGAFEAQIAPGRYLLRAVATGFDTVEARARVAANRETVLDTIALRRINTLADRQRSIDADPYRNVVRGSRGRVFQWDDKTEEEQARKDAEALALTDRDNSAHGVIQTVAASGSANYFSTNFAVTHEVSKADLTIAGQVGVGEDAPLRLEATTATDLGDRHRATVTIGFGRLRIGDTAVTGADQLNQMTIQAVDHWQVAGPLVVVYGLNYSRFSGASSKSATLPRFGVELSPTNRTQIFARMTPGSDARQVASFDMETGEVTFVDPPRAEVPADRARDVAPDRSTRFEVGVGHLIDERSNFEVMAFYDVASGRGIGFLAVPTGDDTNGQFRTADLDGRTSGVRIVYSRRLSEVLTAKVGYAAGKGMELNEGGLADPTSLFRPAMFQVVSGEIEADFESGTRVSATYRYNPQSVVFAIDPFAGRMTSMEPTTSFFVAQPLPMPDFFPGQWEAMVDVRNVFDAVPSTEDHELLLADYSRLIRAGLTFRF